MAISDAAIFHDADHLFKMQQLFTGQLAHFGEQVIAVDVFVHEVHRR